MTEENKKESFFWKNKISCSNNGQKSWKSNGEWKKSESKDGIQSVTAMKDEIENANYGNAFGVWENKFKD